MPCCLDDQDDYHTHDVDHNCFVADQDNHREQYDDVDHNPDKGTRGIGSALSFG